MKLTIIKSPPRRNQKRYCKKSEEYATMVKREFFEVEFSLGNDDIETIRMLMSSVEVLEYLEHDNEKALIALKDFLEKYKKTPNSKIKYFHTPIDRRSNLDYIKNLFILDTHLKNKEYCEACNEISDIIFLWQGLSYGVKDNLIFVLEKYIK
jgi:hypothetical protein